MALLLLFAFISGLITIAAPCIWPLLPIVLSVSSTGGHRKPLGITLGVILSFGILILTISYIVRIIPFDTNILRILSVLVIGFLGLTLIIPPLSQKLEGYASRFSGKLQTSTRSGFLGGLITGAVLGIVWTPCAGPILATIATLSATQKVNSSLILVTIFYLFGVAIPLFIFSLIGRKIFLKSKKLSPYLGRIQQIFGVIMIITAALIFTNYDKVLEAKLLNVFPSYANFQNKFEENKNVTNGLNKIKNSSGGNVSDNSLLNTNAPAPDFAGITNWLNSKPLTLSDLKGKVVLVDFWTYTCINCIRTLPHVTSWYNKYKNDGFVVVGVHTPEFQFEHETANVASAIKQFGILYPVAQDNNYATWNAYSNQYWPAEYLIDVNGNIRREEFGEGEYDQTEKAIQLLLKEAGKKVTSKTVNIADQTPNANNLSPETYLGSARMEYFFPNGSVSNGESDFVLQSPPENSFSLGGKWDITDENAQTVSNSTLTYNLNAQKVYLVMAPTEKSQSVKVFLDGELIGSDSSGSDVKNGVVNIGSDRLYSLVSLKDGTANHTLLLEFSNGIKVFAFTFG